MGSNVTSGNLLVVSSKFDNTGGTPILLFTNTGVTCSWTTAIAGTNVGVLFAGGSAYCVASSTGAATITMVQSGGTGGGSFSDITVAEYSVSTSWKVSTLDAKIATVTSTASTTCSAGPTSATVQNNELVVAGMPKF